jgi:hypothetical protein
VEERAVYLHGENRARGGISVRPVEPFKNVTVGGVVETLEM